VKVAADEGAEVLEACVRGECGGCEAAIVVGIELLLGVSIDVKI
jgi:hypothetical protein